jgi:hypothetical protein
MKYVLIALAFIGHDVTLVRVERYATLEACERQQVAFLDANRKARADCVPAERVRFAR